MRHPRLLLPAVAGLLAALTAPAAAEGELGLELGARFAPSPGLDAVTADRALAIAAIGGAIRFDRVRPLGLELALLAQAERFAAEGSTYHDLGSQIAVTSLRVGAALRRPIVGRLAGFGRLLAGYTTAALTLDADGRSTRIADRAHGASAVAGVGLDVDLGATSGGRLRVGLRAALDYTRVSPLSFRAAPDAGEDAVAIDTAPAALGDLDLSGLGLRVGVFGRF